MTLQQAHSRVRRAAAATAAAAVNGYNRTTTADRCTGVQPAVNGCGDMCDGGRSTDIALHIRAQWSLTTCHTNPHRQGSVSKCMLLIWLLLLLIGPQKLLLLLLPPCQV
jgi:hypothetical protein